MDFILYAVVFIAPFKLRRFFQLSRFASSVSKEYSSKQAFKKK